MAITKEAKAAYDKIYREAHKHIPPTKEQRERRHWKTRQRLYGITQQEYENLLLFQGDRCAICYTSDKGNRQHWDIDHDHASGRVRGLVCNNCNRGMGFFKDNSVLLHNALTYLDRVRF